MIIDLGKYKCKECNNSSVLDVRLRGSSVYVECTFCKANLNAESSAAQVIDHRELDTGVGGNGSVRE